MMALCARCASAFVLALPLGALAHAQVREPAGVLSFVESSYVPGHVEIVEMATFRACQARGLEVCEGEGEHVVYRLPFQLEVQVERAVEEIDEAWELFFERVVARIHVRLNALPPCWNPLLTCGAHVDWACVFQRQVMGVAEAFAEFQPLYWSDVVAAITVHLPLSLWWEGVLPLQDGAVVAALVSQTPRPDQYLDLVEEPRDVAYYFQPPAFAELPRPYAVNELDIPEYPGLVDKEEAKRALARATAWEYEQFGFTGLWQAFSGFEDTLFMRWPLADRVAIPMPSIVGSICLIPYPPFVAMVPFIPVPTFVPQVPKAFYGAVTVPEGYGVPRLAGKPLFALPDLDTLLAQAPLTLPAQPQADLELEIVPCLPREASWPPPGFESEELGPPPGLCPPGTPLPQQFVLPNQ